MKKIKTITKNDYEYIQKIINQTGLSNYLIQKEDFICYKD